MISLCTELKIENCIIHNSLFVNSGFVLANSLDLLNISFLSISKNLFFFSSFVTIANFMNLLEENSFFFSNILNDSVLLNFSNQIAIGRNLEFNKFSVFNNQLHDNSHFIQINLLVLVESIGFSNFIIYNNSFQKAFIKIASKFHVIFFEFSNSIFMENEILEGLVQLSFQSV